MQIVLGPYIAVLKTHIDIVSDLGPETFDGLTKLAKDHDFLIFEDRKFIDIGNTAQKQYKGGALRIHDWAHIINASVLPGPGVIQALDETISKGNVGDRGILILAEMTSKGSLAVGDYTKASVDIARQYPSSVIGFVSTRSLSGISHSRNVDEDMIVFTTGINMATKGDLLGQQYQTPGKAVAGGADFLIAGRGLYADTDPVAATREYQEAGWSAYLQRIGADGT
jgi:orotidine-5'-phosphate decarboxylase